MEIMLLILVIIFLISLTAGIIDIIIYILSLFSKNRKYLELFENITLIIVGIAFCSLIFAIAIVVCMAIFII